MVRTHILLDKDPETKLGRCIICGPTPIVQTHSRGQSWWVCGTFRKINQARIHGISLEEKQRMIASQSGLCAICNVVMEKPQIDHSHYGEMQIREMLCVRCNLTLGNVKDSIPLLVQMILYLKKHGVR